MLHVQLKAKEKSRKQWTVDSKLSEHQFRPLGPTECAVYFASDLGKVSEGVAPSPATVCCVSASL